MRLSLVLNACGCEPTEPFCTCPSAASALAEDRDDDDDLIPFDPFHDHHGRALAGVLA